MKCGKPVMDLVFWLREAPPGRRPGSREFISPGAPSLTAGKARAGKGAFGKVAHGVRLTCKQAAATLADARRGGEIRASAKMAIFYTELHNRLPRSLLAAEQP